VHSNADMTANDQAQDWYALTWVWRTAAVYQRVTVVVNQAAVSQSGQPADPPAPRGLTWRNSLLDPLLWVARQQPISPGIVSPEVSGTAQAVASKILAAGASR
jgi:hypothetical protein